MSGSGPREGTFCAVLACGQFAPEDISQREPGR